MNLVLITEKEAADGLPAEDPRTHHLLRTVGLGEGQSFHVGIAGAKRGIARITDVAPVLRFTVRWEPFTQRALPLTVLIGLPRPQTAKKVLHDLASLGASRMIFFEAEKGDPGYLASSLWKNGEWEEHVRKGAEQACSTRIPEVSRIASLSAAIALTDDLAWRVALDPYEAGGPLDAAPPESSAAVLAIGPERGWSEAERAALRAARFDLRHLGDRILRVEAACLVGGALMLSRLNAWEAHRPLAE